MTENSNIQISWYHSKKQAEAYITSLGLAPNGSGWIENLEQKRLVGIYGVYKFGQWYVTIRKSSETTLRDLIYLTSAELRQRSS